MSNQNKTSKTLLITAMLTSLGFLSIAQSTEPQLDAIDKVSEKVEVADTVVTQETEISESSEDVVEASSDEVEATIEEVDNLTEDEKKVKEKGKCGG